MSFLKKLTANLFGLIPLLIVLMIPLGANSQSINKYQQIAAENNPRLRASFNQYLAALEESPQVGAFPNLEVSFTYFISPIETRLGLQQAGISVAQMFPWFGTYSDLRSAAVLQAKAAFEAFQENRNRLFYDVEQTLLDLYEMEYSIDIAENNLEIINSLVEISLRRYEINQVTQVDVLRAQIEQEDLRVQIALLRDNRQVLIQKVSELLNKNETLNISLPDSLPTDIHLKSADMLLELTVQRNPGLNRLRLQERSTEQMRKVAKNEGRPSFRIGLDYVFMDGTDMAGMVQSRNDGMMLMAGVSIPIFRKKYRANIRQSKFELRAVQDQVFAEKNELETVLETTLRDFSNAVRQYELIDNKQIQRVSQALRIMMQAYSSDSSDFEEILRMQRLLLDYQLSRISAITEMNRAAAFIDYLTGENNITPKEINLK